MSAKPKTELDGPSVASVHNTNVSLRDYFAAHALVAGVPDMPGDWEQGDVATWCYEMADILLAKRGPEQCST